MLSFGKKKDPNNVKSSPKPSAKKSSGEPSVSKEDIKHLEETKHRLFGFGTKKTQKIKELSANFDKNGKEPPAPPPKPIRLTHSHIQHHVQRQNSDTLTNSTGHPTVSSPDTPFSDGQEEFGFHPLKTFAFPGLNLPALKSATHRERNVRLKKLQSGEFNVALRRAQIVDRRDMGADESRIVFFVEPLNPDYETPLLPGDTLLAVNGVMINDLNKNQVVQLIGSCESDELELTVRPVSELANYSITNAEEFNSDYNILDTARGDLNLFPIQKHQELISQNHSSFDVVDLFANEANTRVWLAHKEGFSAAKLIETIHFNEDNRKIKIQLEQNDQIVEVDADDIEKANPPSLDNVDNLKDLTYLNECSVLHLLRRRVANNLIHTFAGSQNMLVLDGDSSSSSMYSEKVIKFFKNCRRNQMPPHIYAVAQKTYRAMMSNKKSQAVVFAGRSGTGKTTKLKHFLQYLCLTVGSVGNFLNVDKLNSALYLLETFGNCRTLLNLNASRFATLFTLDFDNVGLVSGVFLQGLLLEHHRVVRRPEGEQNFNIFYYFWQGLDQELKNELFLNSIEDIDLLMSPNEKISDNDSSRSSLIRLCTAMKTLQIADTDTKAIWTTLAAIFHLAAAGATKGIPSFKATFLKPIHAQKASQLLGVALEDLQKTIFMSSQNDQQIHREQRLSSSSSTSRNVFSNPRRISDNEKLTRKDIGPMRLSLEKMSITDRPGDGQEALEAFLIGLYRELFSAVICLINKSLSVASASVATSICLIDCPGYQRPPADRKSTSRHGAEQKLSAGFGEFVFNYLNERLNGLFYQTCISRQLELYAREQIEFDFGHDIPAPYSVIDLIDRQLQQQMLKSTNLELRSQEKRGLLWLLDEESIFPGASDESFMERIFVHHGDRKDNLLKKSRRHNHFVVRHALGSFPVTYNVGGWLKLAQENPVTRSVLSLLQNSRKDFVSSLYSSLRSSGLPGLPPTLSASLDNNSLRRTTSVFKTLVAPQTVIKRKSNCSMCKLQADLIVENVLRMSAASFVHCFQSHEDFDHRNRTDVASETNLIDVPLVRNQMRSFQLLEAVRLDKIGFPEHMTFGDFKKRFECLALNDYKLGSTLLDDKIAVERLLVELDAPTQTSFVVLGLSRIFLKSELLSKFEDRRDEKLSIFVTGLQAVCRSLLARKRLEKRKIQILSIRCIQKNITKYMKVKSWPWWRLYTRVAPLVNVNRTDEELRSQSEELESLRTKTAKLDKSYAELRSHCDRLEARLTECQAELVDERNVSSMATEALEFENKTRLRFEKELQELQAKFLSATTANQRMEMQILEFKSLKNASILASSGDEDDEPPQTPSAPGNLMRDRIREMKKQIEVQRKTLTLEKMDEIEHHTSLRKQTEKKLSEYQKENDELRESVNIQKRRTQKLNDELQDLRTHLQQVTSRNVELEKKQKRFDSEMNALQDRLDQEKGIRDRTTREKDESLSKMYILEQEMKHKLEEIGDLEEKIRRYENEPTSGTVSFDVSNDAHLKKRNLELERKCTDLESELDEMAGEILQLQQNVTRLEMQSNKIKRDQTKEMEKQDEEIDHVRAQMQKKVKMLEQQLDEEQEVNQRNQRLIREMEAQRRDALENRNLDHDEARENILKRNMRKTKALLKDAQVMLEHYQKSAPNRGVVKQLKNQLEDAEALRLAAVKAKQSLENELEDVRRELTSVSTLKNSSEERCLALLREKTTLDSRINDQDYEFQELLKKYKAQVQQGSVAHITLNDQIRRIAELEKERDSLSDKIVELSAYLERFEADTVDKHKLYLADGKVRDLESKLDLETTTKCRLEAALSKSKEDCERVREEMSVLQAAKDRETELSKRFQQQVQNAQDNSLEAQKREAEAAQRCREITSAFERLEQENATMTADLKLSLRRIDDLQMALQSDVDSDDGKWDDDGDVDDDDDDDDVTFTQPVSVSNYSDARSYRRSGSTPSRTSMKMSGGD